MYFKEDCYGIVCDNCQETFQDGHSGYSMFTDENQAHEYADNAEWHLLDKHYCPDCFTIDDEDVLHVNSERTKSATSPSEPSSIPVVDNQMIIDFCKQENITPADLLNAYRSLLLKSNAVVDYEKEAILDALDAVEFDYQFKEHMIDAKTIQLVRSVSTRLKYGTTPPNENEAIDRAAEIYPLRQFASRGEDNEQINLRTAFVNGYIRARQMSSPSDTIAIYFLQWTQDYNVHFAGYGNDNGKQFHLWRVKHYGEPITTEKLYQAYLEKANSLIQQK